LVADLQLFAVHALDAATTLASFTIDGEPERDATSTGDPVFDIELTLSKRNEYEITEAVDKLAKAGALDVMRDFPGQPDAELSTRRCLERLVFAGTAKTVAGQILEFRDEVGAFGTLLYTGHDWADPALARRSMELTANEVLPNIHRAIRGRARKV